MHIPDGFLSTPVWATLDVLALPAAGWLARRAQRGIEENRLPLLGVMGAFVFAAQMINFPVGAGTSGHLVGSALLAFTLGPAAAAVVMTAILAVQALIFQDGGILALGANVWNMAICGVAAAWLPYRYWANTRWRRAAIFLGATLSVFTGACLALAQLLLSGVAMPGAVLGVSLGLFLVAAVLEGVITLAVLTALERINPGWIRQPDGDGRLGVGLLLAGAVFLAAVGALFASALPDGLEKFAEEIGIAGRARNLMETPLADYVWKGLPSEPLGQSAAGLVGVAAVFALLWLAARWMRRRRA